MKTTNVLSTSTDETDVREQAMGLSLEGVTKRYGDVEALRPLDLDVPQGEFLTVLGPSGSGKTTLLRLISGFTNLTGGTIRLLGADVSNMTPADRSIGMVFQNYALFPHLTAGRNVTYGLKMRGWSRDDRRERAKEVLRLVGLEGMYDRYTRELSGGQQQRVALGRALAFFPKLLLMDEPLGALDRELRIRMAGELRRIHAEFEATVVYVTHDREEALTLSDRIAILRDGSLVAIDTPDALFRRPSTGFVASFFGGHNVVPAKLASTSNGSVERLGDGERVTVEALGNTITVHKGGEPPQDQRWAVALPTQAVFSGTRDNSPRFEARVVEALYMGEVTQVTLEPLGTGGPARIQADVHGGTVDQFSAGEVMEFGFDASRCVGVARDIETQVVDEMPGT